MIPGNDNNGGQERRTLWIVLLLNAAIAAGFFVSGFFADSSALIAFGSWSFCSALRPSTSFCWALGSVAGRAADTTSEGATS